MKKTKLIALILALLLAVQTFPCAALAAEAEPETTEATTQPAETTDATEATGEETTDSTGQETVPAQTQTELLPGGSNAGVDAPRALAGPEDLNLDAAAVLLLELNSMTMVYAKEIDTRREPASLTKVMTCLLALENGTLTDEITVSEEALADMDPSGSSSGLLVGEIFTLEQLLYCLMIESANDAAPVIAEYIAGSESAFVDMMNQKARELGCKNTHFSNTHGLHDENHYTTARDLAKIMLAALEYDKFQEIYSTARYELPATNLHEERILVTTNFLIGTSVTQDYYDDRVIGGKTGFTTPAGRCVMCVAEEDDLKYLCVVLGASNDTSNGYVVYGSFLTATKVLDFGFNSFTFAEVLSPLAPVAQLPVAKATQSVVLAPAESVTTMLPKNFDETKLTTSYELSSEAGLEAPLEAGQAVGVVRRYYGDICVGETDLVTVTAVSRNALAAAAMQTAEKISTSPWRFVIIILAVLLGIILLLFLWSAWIRYRNRKRRQRRRKRG